MDADALAGLRAKVHEFLALHLTEAAVFFAEKLAAASGGAPADAYTLAQALFVDRQHARCLRLLRGSGLVPKDLRFRYLAARCQAEAADWDGALGTLGGPDAEGPAQLPFAMPPPPPGGGGAQRGAAPAAPAPAAAAAPDPAAATAAALCLLRGRAFDALENLPRAEAWYRATLAYDPACVEAWRALGPRGAKLRDADEAALAGALAAALPPALGWLGLLYCAECRAPGGGAAAACLDALEAPAGEALPVDLGGDDPMAASPARAAAGGSARAPPRAEPPLPPALAAAAARGWGLGGSPDVAAARARAALARGAAGAAHAATAAALGADPHAPEPLLPHLAAAVALRRKHELFALAHQLVRDAPGSPMSWYAAGCYYTAAGQHDAARRHFGRAAAGGGRGLAAAWVAYGHAFAAQDESDQAMAAYRTAARLFPGLHEPLAGAGVEYCRMNALGLAAQALGAAHAARPSDPIVLNELGVVALRARRADDAARHLRAAVAAAEAAAAAGAPAARAAPLPPYADALLVNLSHAERRCRRFASAAAAAERALGVAAGAPARASALAALGYARHLGGDAAGAVDAYNAALGLRPGDAFVAEMLAAAAAEDAAAFAAGLAAADGGAAGAGGLPPPRAGEVWVQGVGVRLAA